MSDRTLVLLDETHPDEPTRITLRVPTARLAWRLAHRHVRGHYWRTATFLDIAGDARHPMSRYRAITVGRVGGNGPVIATAGRSIL